MSKWLKCLGRHYTACCGCNMLFLLYFMSQGIYVTRVSKGGPAEVAGLRIGDKIMQVRDVNLPATKFETCSQSCRIRSSNFQGPYSWHKTFFRNVDVSPSNEREGNILHYRPLCKNTINTDPDVILSNGVSPVCALKWKIFFLYLGKKVLSDWSWIDLNLRLPHIHF